MIQYSNDDENTIVEDAGQVTVQAATSGTTTVVSTGATAATPKCRAQYSALTLIKRDTDSWYVIDGRLTPQLSTNTI